MTQKIALLLALYTGTLFAAGISGEQEEFFESKIRPILVDNCFACHTNTKLGGLRMDSMAALLKGGDHGPAIVPGSPEKSLLIQAVQHAGDLKMPKGRKLPETQVALLIDWVKRGAPWPEDSQTMPAPKDGFHITKQQRGFWAFQPLTNPEPPAVLNGEWAKNAIDRFILAKLEQEGVTPSPVADRRTLMRRASLDLVGLPPAPEEIEAFVKDESPEAWEKLIDKLLGSKQYGERWGRFWLDVVRYGEDDTRGLAPGGQGHEKYPFAYLYRDWVIQAFNDDLPYDKFIKAQLAADLMGKDLAARKWPLPAGDQPLPMLDQMKGRPIVPNWESLTKEEKRKYLPAGHIVDETLDQKMLPALGFLGGGPWYYDITEAIQARADERHDRVDVVTRGFLGLTVGCARCHDHKYDPISAKDYYALAAIFYNSPYHEYPLLNQTEVDAWRARDEKVEAQKKRIGEFQKKEGERVGRMLAYQADKYMMGAWKVYGEPKKDLDEVANEDKLDVELLERWVKWLQRPPKHYSFLKDWQAMIADGGGTEEQAVCLAQTFRETLLKTIDDWDELEEKNKKIVAKGKPLEDPPPMPMPNKFRSPFDNYDLTLESMDLETANLYRDVFLFDLDGGDMPGQRRRKPGLLRLSGHSLERWLSHEKRQHLAAMQKDLKGLEKMRGKQYPTVMGVREADVITALPVHLRGNPASLGEAIPPGFLAVLGSENDEPAPFRKGSGRLELAEAIAKSPLAARVIVNRVWKAHFGTGLVNTPSNFGQVGERPTHPELLDHLAKWFVENGMSIKKLHKHILTSTVYQLSADSISMNDKKDPANRLYWRFSPRRLDAEAIRDSMLAVAGTLDLKKVGGQSGDLDSATFKRRTVYGKVSRFRVADYLQVFDFPNPNITAEQRFSTTVPQQRLFFMNSDFVYQQAKALAARVGKPEEPKKEDGKGGPANMDAKPDASAKVEKPAGEEKAAEEKKELPDRDRIIRAYGLLFQRAPSEKEIELGLAFLKDPKSQQPTGDYSKAAIDSWEMYARVLLSSNEFTFLN